MAATDPRIEPEVEAPAWIMVPISENKQTRVVFNAVVDAEFDRFLRSRTEVEYAWERMTEHWSDEIEAALGEVGNIRPSNSDDLERVYSSVRSSIEAAMTDFDRSQYVRSARIHADEEVTKESLEWLEFRYKQGEEIALEYAEEALHSEGNDYFERLTETLDNLKDDYRKYKELSEEY